MRLLACTYLFLPALITAELNGRSATILPFTPALAANNDTAAAPQTNPQIPPPQDTPLPIPDPELAPPPDIDLETYVDKADSQGADHSLELRSTPTLDRRQNPCASTYAQCPQSPSMCCPQNSQCLADAQGMVGCCPNGAACTGVVPTASASATSTATSSASAMSVSSTNALASLTSSGFISGQTVFAAAAPERGRVREVWGVAVWAVGGVLLL